MSERAPRASGGLAAVDTAPEPASAFQLPEAQGSGGQAFADFIGLRHEGPGVTRLRIEPGLLNGGGLLLGPVGFALVDYSMGSLLWSHRNPCERIATINISLNFVQSAGEGDVECVTTLDRRNRVVAVMSSQVHHEDGRLLMTAVGCWSIYLPRGGPPLDGAQGVR